MRSLVPCDEDAAGEGRLSRRDASREVRESWVEVMCAAPRWSGALLQCCSVATGELPLDGSDAAFVIEGTTIVLLAERGEADVHFFAE